MTERRTSERWYCPRCMYRAEAPLTSNPVVAERDQLRLALREIVALLDPTRYSYANSHGPIEDDCPFGECYEVTWCADSQWPTDIEYRLVKKRKRKADKSGVAT